MTTLVILGLLLAAVVNGSYRMYARCPVENCPSTGAQGYIDKHATEPHAPCRFGCGHVGVGPSLSAHEGWHVRDDIKGWMFRERIR